MELIVTEKDNAARRIADILSDGGASTERRNGVNAYRWGDRRCVGLSGHVVGVDSRRSTPTGGTSSRSNWSRPTW